MFLGRDGFIWWIGVVEDNQDPLVLGRAKVRVFGYHAPANTTEMPTADLPWAVVMMPANMPGAYGIPNLGDWVVGFFLDGEDAQEPCILGYIPGIPPDTIPTDIKERFSEQISTVRSFNTVANVLPNSFGITGTKQKDRFRFEQPSGNVFEMVNDTSVGHPVSLVHGSGTYYNLTKDALEFGRLKDGTHFQVIQDKGMDVQARSGDIMVHAPVLPVGIENDYRARSLVPPRETFVNIGIGIIHNKPAAIGVNSYDYYYPSLEDQNPVYDTTNLVKDVRLLMNTVFQPGPITTKVYENTALSEPDFGGGGGGGDCFLGESLVTMSDGTQRRIDQIKDGDYVFNMNKTQVNKVLFIEKVIDKYNWQELYTPSSEFEPFATPNHPLFVDGEWVAMEQGLYPWLEDVNPVKNPITRKVKGDLVYNLWITGDGTYIVNGFGTTSIMMHGGIMRVAYQYGYLTQDYIMKLMREFTTQGAEMTHGAYIFNNLFAHITHKPSVKVMANTIKREHSFLPRKAMIFLMKVFGKAATLYNKLKG